MDPASASQMLALLLQLGVCGKSDFHTSDGTTLRVIVCPVAMGQDDAEPPPAKDPTRAPHKPIPKDEL